MSKFERIRAETHAPLTQRMAAAKERREATARETNL